MKSSRRTIIPLTALCVLLSALALTGATARPSARAETLVPPGGEQVEIIRDGYGVPHVYAETREGVAFGAGYALAQDRLWQMEVLRHTAKGRLSDFLGVPGTPVRDGLRSQDRTVRFFTYTE